MEVFLTDVIALNITTRTSETGTNYQKLKILSPLLCHFCCSLPSRWVSPAQPAGAVPSLAGRWAGSDPPTGNKRPEQTFLLGQRNPSSNATLLHQLKYLILLVLVQELTAVPLNSLCSYITVFICILKHTKRFEKLVELLPNGYSFWILSHVVMDHCLIVVEDTVLDIIQTINIFHSCMHLQTTINHH